jgi:hypothetical protein
MCPPIFIAMPYDLRASSEAEEPRESDDQVHGPLCPSSQRPRNTNMAVTCKKAQVTRSRICRSFAEILASRWGSCRGGEPGSARLQAITISLPVPDLISLAQLPYDLSKAPDMELLKHQWWYLLGSKNLSLYGGGLFPMDNLKHKCRGIQFGIVACPLV